MEISSAPHSRSCSFRTRARPNDLQLKKARQRTNSVPNCQLFLKLPEEGSKTSLITKDQLCRVRSFKTTSKHVINRGDSFKNKSTNSLMSSGSAVTEPDKKQRTHSVTSDDSQPGSSAPSYFKVAIIGSLGAGKSTLIRQFMTSECMGYNATSPDVESEPETTVSVLLDGEESMMEFIEDPQLDEYDDLQFDAYIAVFSIIDQSSFESATNLIRHLRVTMGTDRAILLAANKIDLVRQRRVNANEARTIAMKYDCNYMETCAALNHYVDELLVKTLSQIRLKLSPPLPRLRGATDDLCLNKQSSPKRALSFLCKLFRRNGRKARSCDNLFVF